MRKYINIDFGTKKILVDIDEELLRKLKRTLKRNLEFDSNGYLKTDFENDELSYRVKQLALKSLLDQLNNYELDSNLKDKFDYIKNNLGGKKTTVYGSDLTNIERLFGEAIELYDNVKSSNAPKKDKETREKELREKIDNSHDISEKIEVAMEVIDNASEELGDYLTEEKLEETWEDLVVASSSDEYESVAREETLDKPLDEESKPEKIVVTPDISVEDIVKKVVTKASNGTPIEEDVKELVEKDINGDIVAGLNKLTSNIKVKGLNYKNLNYFGDSFIEQCERLARENGQSIESLFSDYFSSSGSTRANSVLNRFILQFITRNGNDSSLRGLIEATLVKKAAAKHLISNKYNYYLEEKYRYLNVNGNGYVYFNDEEEIKAETKQVGNTEYNENFESQVSEDSTVSAEGNMESNSTVSNSGDVNTSINGEVTNNFNINSNVSGGASNGDINGSLKGDTTSSLNVNVNVNSNINGNINSKNNLNANTNLSPNGMTGRGTKGIKKDASNSLPETPRGFNSNQALQPSINGGLNGQNDIPYVRGNGLQGNNNFIGVSDPNMNIDEGMGNPNMAMASLSNGKKDALGVNGGANSGINLGMNLGEGASSTVGMRNRAQDALAAGKGQKGKRVSPITSKFGKKNLAQGDISNPEFGDGYIDDETQGADALEEPNLENNELENPDVNNKEAAGSGAEVQNNDNDSSDESLEEAAKNKLKKELGKRLIALAKKHPAVVMALVIGLLFLLLLLFIVISFNNEDKTNMFGLGGYPYIELSNVCEQIHVYDTPSGEDGTYPLEEYIAGVVAHEVGAFNDDTLYEVFAIAARTYALRRLQNSSDCSIAGNTTAQVFGKTDNEKIIEAVNRTRGLVLADNGSLISTEYDAFCWDTKDDNYYNICQKDYDTGNVLKVPVSWAEEYVGKISGKKFLTTPRYQSHGRGMSQQGAYYMAMELGYTREQILSFFYGNSSRLMSIYASSYTGEFPLNPNDPIYQNLDFLINRSLDSLLIANDTHTGEFNNYLASVVEESGVGTREAVVNVAVSLIGSLANMGYKLNYQWGGKYYAAGVNPNWGNITNPNNYCGSYGAKYNITKCTTHYKWISFDCSGFVNWAFINGFGLKSFSELQSKGIYTLTQTSTANRKNLKANAAVCGAGDVLIKPGAHIVLIVGIDSESKRYIVAESTGSNISTKTGGVKLSYYNYNASGYFCGDMSSIYGTSANTEEE